MIIFAEFSQSTFMYLSGIDFTKFIMAFAVVAIHSATVFGYVNPPAVEWFIRLAVPFFFVVTGMFLGQRLGKTNDDAARTEILKTRSRQCFKIWFKWTLIYFPLGLVSCIQDGEGSLITSAAKLIGTTILTGGGRYYWHLWFVYSMVFSLLAISLIYLFPRRRRLTTGVLLTAFLMIQILEWAVRCDVCHIPSSLFYANYVLKSVLGGGLYIMGGIYMSRYVRRFTPTACIATALVLVACSILCFNFELPFWELAGALAMLAASMIAMTEHKISVAAYFRKTSMWIYFVHMYCLVGLSALFIDLGAECSPATSFAIAAALSWALASGLNWLQGKPHFEWLAKFSF